MPKWMEPGLQNKFTTQLRALQSDTIAIMPETSISPPAVTRPSKPVSEALLNEKWDHCLSSMLIRSSVGLGFGVVASVLIFKRRAWPAFVGVGFGAGRAYEECNTSFRRVGKDGIRVQRP
ncbi:putative micos complex subunit [Botrytis fragariae]|nr:putative micos complex subunit [Botrytis fragariae]XP_038732830.1 uncharacterized protein EAE97_005841 [Botrytis byssoidea]KAF5871975.1 putative micos complex subunit [Botrytis fragariae]KAF7902917.1 hypothetical protein EAF00_002819 [Botryotinia globosa]KAF7943771.1 hypothetical protein EAE97_005841 [Botrytis byssoidea]